MRRVIRVRRYGLLCDGVQGYAVIEPFTVYGWNEITIVDLVYIIRPKPRWDLADFSGIGTGLDYQPETVLTATFGNLFDKVSVKWVVRRPIGYPWVYRYDFYEPTNSWVCLVRRFTQGREYSVWVDGDRKYQDTVPSDYKTILEWNPDTAMYRDRFKRFVLGASTGKSAYMSVIYGAFLVYDVALPDSRIAEVCVRPYRPPREGLRVWLMASPEHVIDLDGDGVLEWVDLSGNGNHAKIYLASLVGLVKAPVARG